MRAPAVLDVDLHHHGDADTAPDLLDLAVNVRRAPAPGWLREALMSAMGELTAYPDQRRARAAVATRHRRPERDVLLTAGAAEAFVLLARALRPVHAVVVHPQFTEPEAALRAAGHGVERVVLEPPFRLDGRLVPETADLVVVGNPTNPTSVLHPASVLAGLARPWRTLVVDEAFADCVPGEPQSLASRRDLPGLVVVRSLTKTWGLAGLRCGYLLAAADLRDRLAAAQPLWPVSTPALAALEACVSAQALADSDAWARSLEQQRDYLCARLGELPQVRVVPEATASFVLVELPEGEAVRAALRARGVAVRRGDTFPGLGPDWLRIAVRDRATTDVVVSRLTEICS